MKITCPFCKVSYSINSISNNIFKCAVCGHVWRKPIIRKNRNFLVFLLSVLVLLLAAFSLIALVLWAPLDKQGPLFIHMKSAHPVDDVLVVSGIIENKSEKLHGVPDLIVIIKNDKNIEVSSQKFTPPVPLLGSGEKANFLVQVHNVPTGSVKISVELSD